VADGRKVLEVRFGTFSIELERSVAIGVARGMWCACEDWNLGGLVLG
jgi:hypothetical protein